MNCGSTSTSTAPDYNDGLHPPCNAASGLTANQTVAVETIMGENSNYLIGRSPYPGAPIITGATVYQEDIDMFSVLANRAQASSSTIGGVIPSYPGQFLGLPGGTSLFNRATVSAQGSALCNDLTAVVGAMNYVLRMGRSCLLITCIGNR